MTLRRHFGLPREDEDFLNEYGLPWESIVDGSQWVLIHDFLTRGEYNHATATVAIRIETGYPLTELNMVYFFPAIARKDGKLIGATEDVQQLDGKSFQRWSRHRTGQNAWKVNHDNLGTHIFLVEDWLEREFQK